MKPLSIHARLILLVLASTVPLIVFAVSLVLWHSNTEERVLREQASRTAGVAMQAVDRELSGITAGLQVLAASPALAQQDFEAFHAQAKSAVGIAGNSVIILYDRNGNRIMSTAAEFGVPLPARRNMSVLAVPFDTRKPQVTPLFISETVKQPTVGIVVPVVLGGEVRYVLGAGLLSQRLSELVVTSGLPSEWIAALLDQDGTIIARTKNPDQYVGTKALPDVWQRMQEVKGPAGNVEGLTKEGARVLLTFTRSGASGWTAVIGIPSAALQGQLHTSLFLVFAAAAAVLLLASFLAWWAARHISQPAIQLQAVARALQEGKQVYPAATGIAQFDDLAQAMEHAGSRIREREVSLRESLHELGVAHGQLRYEQGKKDEFIATLAHELRNPLAPIRNGLDVLRRSPPAQVASRTLGIMDRQLSHMVRLIDDLLDVSRIARGKLVLQKDHVSLQKIISDAIDATDSVLKAGGQNLVLHIPEYPLWLNADPARLCQVVTNILDNAVKFSGSGESITVTVTSDTEQCEVRISDNGIGIPPEKLKEIFDLFSQIRSENDRGQHSGLGVGLSLSRMLVELHGGSIVALSEGLGRGATFVLRLALAEIDRGDNSVALLHGPHRTPALRVLVVDDNEDAADMLATILRISGHRAYVANDGPGALQFAHDNVVDVVVLDIGMPEMSGHEVCRRLREIPRYAQVKIVAVTGWGAEADRQKSREAGFDAHLTKPVDFEAIEQVLYGITREISGSAANSP